MFEDYLRDRSRDLQVGNQIGPRFSIFVWSWSYPRFLIFSSDPFGSVDPCRSMSAQTEMDQEPMGRRFGTYYLCCIDFLGFCSLLDFELELDWNQLPLFDWQVPVSQLVVVVLSVLELAFVLVQELKLEWVPEIFNVRVNFDDFYRVNFKNIHS